MDRTALADELRSARFRTTQFRAGYGLEAVDELIDTLVGQLTLGVADHEIVQTAQSSRFPTFTARRGYEMAEVDALLERVVTTLDGAAAPTPTDAPTSSSTSSPAPSSTPSQTTSTSAEPLPSALIEPPRGFLARLLGR
jgi:DivIVA domain-containing protein